MGRTVLPFSTVLAEQRKRLGQFRRSLRKQDQELFDELFPLRRLEAGVDMYGNVVEIAAKNSAWDLDHPAPPLRVMRMRGERMRPPGPSSRIIIATDNEETSLYP